MSTITYSDKIPNNVNLSEDRALQRALEQWQPNYLQWWGDMGPDGSQDFDVYLRTAVSVDPQGWAQFGHVKMPDYRWGIFLNPGEKDRKIHFGDHKGEKAWQDVPGEQQGHVNIKGNYLGWRGEFYWNRTDFYDIFGPTKRSWVMPRA